MIKQLPKWVELGGFVLAFNAGFINAMALLGFQHQAVSHLTGISTFLSLALANHHMAEVLHLLLMMASFILGAAYSGLVVGGTALKLGRRYGLALLTEAALLGAAMLCLTQGWVAGHFFASAACGLQNAMTSTYSGAVVRTTHVSGLFTDLGLMLGLRCRGQAADPRKIMLYTTLICGFVLGGVAGALGFAQHQFWAMAVPCAITASAGLGYLVWVRYQHATSRPTRI